VTTERRVVIADDEPVARRGVCQLLARFPDWRVVAECRDGAETLAAITRHRPDAVFLDIEMPGLSGLDVARHGVSDNGPALVFLTAHSQHALAAFDTAALDYLVKPVTATRFARTMQRLAARIDARGAHDARTLVVSAGRGTLVLPLAEVEWIQSADHYARVWSGGRGYLLREPLSDLEQRLTPAGFLRVHRSVLLRLSAVRGLGRSRDGDLYAVMTSGAKVPVSRRRASAISAAIKTAPT
jgi:two-component system LytT family response regulator